MRKECRQEVRERRKDGVRKGQSNVEMKAQEGGEGVRDGKGAVQKSSSHLFYVVYSAGKVLQIHTNQSTSRVELFFLLVLFSLLFFLLILFFFIFLHSASSAPNCTYSYYYLFEPLFSYTL